MIEPALPAEKTRTLSPHNTQLAGNRSHRSIRKYSAREGARGSHSLDGGGVAMKTSGTEEAITESRVYIGQAGVFSSQLELTAGLKLSRGCRGVAVLGCAISTPDSRPGLKATVPFLDQRFDPWADSHVYCLC